jgi:transcriptional regulator with XRE-family HTH domain
MKEICASQSIAEICCRQRKARALKQDDVARLIGVGRTTIVAIENQRAGRVAFDTVLAFADAVGVRIDAAPDNQDREIIKRRLVRAEHAIALERRKARLLLIALNLKADQIKAARAQVDLWEKNETCSRFYIDRWRELLGGPMPAVGKKIGKCLESEWGSALLQNCPFHLRPAQ